MTQSSYPFDIGEEQLFELIRKTIGQYRAFESSRISKEVKRKLQFHTFNTTSHLVVAVLRCGCDCFSVYVGADAPSGRPYQAELSVRV